MKSVYFVGLPCTILTCLRYQKQIWFLDNIQNFVFVIILINVIHCVLNPFIAFVKNCSWFPSTYSLCHSMLYTSGEIRVDSYCNLQSAVLICMTHIAILKMLMLPFWGFLILSYNIVQGQIFLLLLNFKFLILLIHMTYEDGTDRVFWNINT
jgi:hypothetical protein